VSATDPSRPTPEPIDTRRYGWIVGGIATVLVIAFVVYSLTTQTPSSNGVPVGRQLHFFAAPLAASTLNGDANLNPPCTLARHDPRALNVCLLVKRGPLVLGFFVTNSSVCEREVSTLQALALQPQLRGVQFAAVAINASHATAAKAVTKHGWTIPVAYDADGGVGAVYGVTACPMLELAERGGRVVDTLIGEHWLNETALEARVRPLLGARVSG
jgi:peroxiredoxin